jgi:uncharacterized protein (TIGR02996 family)
MKGGLPNAFLKDIVANIDDDTPRLVYADWLDENGHPERAEFIRVQVERARLPAWDAAQVPLRLREKALLEAHGEEWLAELPKVEGARWEGFRRGIVAEVSFASFEAMRESAHACRGVAPVEAVTVRWPRRREARKDAPPVAELRELTLTGRPDAEDEIARLADSPQLATLRVLTARGLWPEGLARLVASLHLAPLEALRLPANNLGNAGILALIESSALCKLAELDLSGRGVSERYNDDPVVRSLGMESLAAWPGLASVRSLNLSGNELGQAGLRALLRSKNAAGLKELSLRSTRIDGRAMAEFDSAVPGFRPESLDLGENVEYAAIVPCLRELKSLRLDRCEVRQAGAQLFAKKAKFLGELRVLEVGHNHFGPAGVKALLEREPPALHTLGLRDNDVHDEGVGFLAGSPASRPLRELDLSLNHLGAAAAASLSASPHLSELLVLRLAENPISGPEATAMAASPLGKRLAVLELDNHPPLPGSPPVWQGDDIPF